MRISGIKFFKRELTPKRIEKIVRVQSENLPANSYSTIMASKKQLATWAWNNKVKHVIIDSATKDIRKNAPFSEFEAFSKQIKLIAIGKNKIEVITAIQFPFKAPQTVISKILQELDGYKELFKHPNRRFFVKKHS